MHRSTINLPSFRVENMSSLAVPPTAATVLVVEDEIELSRLFVEVLTAAGYAAVPAYSVTDALAALAYQRFDAAILDVELRDGAVFPVADRLAEEGTPYLFASAIYFQAIPRAHQDVPFVGKPFNVDELLLRVEQVISGVALSAPAG